MNLGLGTLTDLKRHLLAPALVAQGTYDPPIIAIGQGVAAQFDKFCNRKFARMANDTVVFPADRKHYYLPRYPVESIATIEQKDSQTEGFIALAADTIENRDDAAGLIYFGAALGDWWSLIRVTYTGGYWFDDDDGDPETQPAGSTALPADLKLAWLQQCAQVWSHRDKLGLNISRPPSGDTLIAAAPLTDEVKEILRGYVRYQLT